MYITHELKLEELILKHIMWRKD